MKKAIGHHAGFMALGATVLNSIVGGKPMKTQACRALRTMVLGLAAILVGGGVAEAITFVVPNSLATVEGNSSAGQPFVATFEFAGGTNTRYQQVYVASEFTSFGAPLFITEIALRADASATTDFAQAPVNYQIDLSTTSAASDGLSTTFSNNVGPDDTVVFSGLLSLTGTAIGQPVPRNFNTVITFQTPFLYDPLAGNLLLDVRRFDFAGIIYSFDAQNSPGDSVSRVFADFSGGGVNSPTANRSDTIGLVTQFTVTAAPVPEPGTLLLLGSSLAGAAGYGWRRRRRQ